VLKFGERFVAFDFTKNQNYVYCKPFSASFHTGCTSRAKVAGFHDLFKCLKLRMKTSGRSESTLNNYARHVAQMALHFNMLPTELDEDQIEVYLYLLQQQHNTPSES